VTIYRFHMAGLSAHRTCGARGWGRFGSTVPIAAPTRWHSKPLPISPDIAAFVQDPATAEEQYIAQPERSATLAVGGVERGATTSRSGSPAPNARLCLDGLTGFARNAQEMIRQPLEERVVTIARSQMMLPLPSNFMMVAAMNPCR
jgi:hypothetical protein